MASSGERRMLFDTRGRRKNVIRVVYAILALLMGASLFVAIGPFNLSEILSTQSSGGSAASALDEQAERIEGRLAKNPNDEQLLLALTRARISAGNAQIEVGSEAIPAAAQEEFEAGTQAWSRYLKQADGEPSASAAQLVAGTFFRLAESETSIRDAESQIARGTEAQRIAAEQQPSVGSLSTLAIYEYYNGEHATADKTTKRAAALAPSKAEAKNIERQLAGYRKRSKKFAQQKKLLAKAQQQANKEQLQKSFGGLGGPPAGE